MFEFPPISEHAVLKQLLKLSPFKSSGCRILTNRVLREIAPFIAGSLAYLYNLSINSAVFPDEWETAFATPVFKNRGKSSDATNYRPISLLPTISKVLDTIQCKSFTSYLLRNHLSDHQFGYLPGRSLQDAAITPQSVKIYRSPRAKAECCCSPRGNILIFFKSRLKAHFNT